ncbi:MAG TPA: ribbon-helix-helix protein, CopG family [Candidatus Binataceae bacterium]|nr:ribbon-helix-helix protein, CopG family [Candidatus Binataceae bacterium]
MYANVFSLDMNADKTTTVRMSGATLKRVDSVARAMSRSRAWVINQAVERYIDYEEWFVAEVKKGLAEVRVGAVVEHAAVRRKWERKRAGGMKAPRQ